MFEINVVGDFCTKQVAGLTFGNKLRDLLLASDINIVNVEAPIYIDNSEPILKSGPNLNQDSTVSTFLLQHKFNLFCLANNHTMDYGEDCLIETIKSFPENTTLGVGTWDKAYSLHIQEIEGCKVALLSVTQFEFGVLSDEYIQKKDVGTAWMCHPVVEELIQKAKSENDYLVILPHAGLEHFNYPLPELRTLYRHFISMGADAVIAGHPHVPQPFEYYKNKPIVYSLGNFIFDALPSQNAYWNIGLLANLRFANNHIAVTIIPIEYDTKSRCVEITTRADVVNHIETINSIFNDEALYISEVNKHCINLSYLYDLWFEESGYIKPNIKKYASQIVARIKRKLLQRPERLFQQQTFINNIRCETHRWVISRIYTLKCNKSCEI